MPKVRVGLIGCGFVAELHMYAYRRVYGVDAQVRASLLTTCALPVLALPVSPLAPAASVYRLHP